MQPFSDEEIEEMANTKPRSCSEYDGGIIEMQAEDTIVRLAREVQHLRAKLYQK